MFRNRLTQKPHILQEGCRRRFPQESRTFPDPQFSDSEVKLCGQRVRFRLGSGLGSDFRRPTGGPPQVPTKKLPSTGRKEFPAGRSENLKVPKLLGRHESYETILIF